MANKKNCFLAEELFKYLKFRPNETYEHYQDYLHDCFPYVKKEDIKINSLLVKLKRGGFIEQYKVRDQSGKIIGSNRKIIKDIVYYDKGTNTQE